MNKTLPPFALRILACLLVILNGENAFAVLKPIPASIQKQHDLHVGFPAYTLFSDQHALAGKAQEALSEGTITEIIPGNLAKLAGEKPVTLTLSIPFKNRLITVELESVNIFTGDFSVIAGENQQFPYVPGAYYRGIVRGNTNSLASFSFFNDELYGTISDDANGNIVIGKLNYPGNTTEYIVYAEKNLLRSSSNFCKTADNPAKTAALQHLPPQAATMSTTKCVRLYYEMDYDLYQSNGSSVTTSTNWMTAVHNNVATLYANDNINVGLSQVYVWTFMDPYTGGTSDDQLNLFHSTRTSFNGDVGQLVAIDGGFGGLAQDIDGLCTPFNYSYADVDFSYSSVPTYSWTIEVITHEFGHLLGSPHTHNCSWPGGAIDDCGPTAGYPTEGGCSPGPTPVNGGTIMSYCHLVGGVGINFNNGFGPYPAGAIQSAVNNAACLGASCTVCPVPLNNDCSNATALPINANCVYTPGNLCSATESLLPITCNSGTATHGYDVWYKVTPAQTDMTIKCQSGTSTDAVLSLYSGTCGSLTLLNCSDATIDGGLESITATVVPGTTYYIRIYDYNSNASGTDFAVCVTHNCTAATNNECGNAQPMNIGTSCNFITGELCSATQSMNPSTCSGYASNDALDLWYAITPTQPDVKITCQSGQMNDMVLGLFSGSCGALNLITCNDSTSTGGVEILNASLTPGSTYYIRVYDWSGNQYGTDFQLCTEYIPCAPPANPTGAGATATAICDGSSTTLNVTGTLTSGATWNWYSGSCGGTPVGTGATLTVTPTSTTTYYVRAENGGCYSNCSSVTITVNQIPSSPTNASASPSSVCTGGSSTLNVTGIPTSGATWHWFTVSCGGTSAGIGSSLLVTPSVNTTYYVRAEKSGCYSTCVNTTVTITPIPANPTGTSATSYSVCDGDNTTLTVNGTLSTGATWNWYSTSCGGSFVGSGPSVTVIPPGNTTYYVRAENGSCYSNCSNAIITVIPLPNAPVSVTSTDDTLCEGDATQLSVNGSLTSGSDWYWYAGICGGSSISQGITCPASPVNTETYFVRAEKGNCYSPCMSYVVYVNHLPASPVINVTSDTLSVLAYATYQWYYSGDGLNYTALGNAQKQSTGSDGYYFVAITDSNGCGANSDTILFQNPNFVSGNFSNGMIAVFPNPATNILNIQLSSGAKENAEAKIYDNTGRLIYNGTLVPNTINSISLENYAAGVYHLLIADDRVLYNSKIVKQ